LNNTQGWNKENRHFSLTSILYPRFEMQLCRETATRNLIHAYFDRYGPATLKDAAWWSGLSRSAIIVALNENDQELIEIRTDWARSPFYMFARRFLEFLNAPKTQHKTGLNFLAHEDVALKAYFESRSRYLWDLPAQHAFNQIGEAIPTIMLDGQVIGTWRWVSAMKNITYAIKCRQAASAKHLQQITHHAEKVSEMLRLGWTEGSISQMN
jgi:hypothetical protein